MATRPSNKPLFASTATGTDIQQPDASHQGAGWVFREKPPYEYLNWLMKNYYDWINWFDQEQVVRGAGWTSDAPVLESGPTGGEAAYYSSEPKRLTVKRVGSAGAFVTGMGFGMVAFGMEVEMSGSEAYLTLDLPTGDAYGPYLPKASISAASYSDSLIVVPVAARVTTAGIGTALSAFAAVARDNDDSGDPKVFIGSAELMGRLTPTVDFWVTGTRYQISGCVHFPLNVVSY